MKITVDDSRLHHRQHIIVVDLQNAVEAIETNDNAAVAGNGGPHHTASCSPWIDRNAFPVSHSDYLRHFIGACRKDYTVGFSPYPTGVIAIAVEVFGCNQAMIPTYDSSEFYQWQLFNVHYGLWRLASV